MDRSRSRGPNIVLIIKEPVNETQFLDALGSDKPRFGDSPYPDGASKIFAFEMEQSVSAGPSWHQWRYPNRVCPAQFRLSRTVGVKLKWLNPNQDEEDAGHHDSGPPWPIRVGGYPLNSLPPS